MKKLLDKSRICKLAVLKSGISPDSELLARLRTVKGERERKEREKYFLFPFLFRGIK